VINEIMYNPAVPNAAFVEIHNTSAMTSSTSPRWRLDGAGFTFNDGTIVTARRLYRGCQRCFVFADTYGPFIPIAGNSKGSSTTAARHCA